MDDDEVRRARLARAGITPEQLEEAVANAREATPEELAAYDAMIERGEGGPTISFMTDGSVVRHEVDGTETALQPSASEGPDAEVYQLPERDEDRGPSGPTSST